MEERATRSSLACPRQPGSSRPIPLPSLPLIAAGLGWDIVDPACACPAARMLGARLWRIRSAWSGSASGDWRILCARAEDSPVRVAH